jgi:acetylornithine deacetylase/succinyl-diaminopimelate desuccinylase-like protein
MHAVEAYLKENQSRFVDELGEYVRFASVSAQPEHQKDVVACAEWLTRHLQKIGLEARLIKTSGHPIVLAKTPPSSNRRRPHYLVYGHYDVQPPEPLELWDSPPFEPRITGRKMFARGASDNKGQHLAHINAVEAYLKTGTPLPCDLTFVIEGEEEVGSESLAVFLKQYRSKLDVEAVVVSDNGIPSLKQPGLTYALRGITALEVRLDGPNRDLHSGVYGGSVDNPAMVLCQLLAQLRDRNGRITVPGFYNDVVLLSAFEKQQMARWPYNESQYRRFLGVPRLFGEKGFTTWEQRTSRPTVEINGLTSGYQGEGSKTIVPSWASAKLTFRLVPNQQAERIQRLVQPFLRRLCPPSVRMTLTAGHHGDPYLIAPTSAPAQAAMRALRRAFGAEPLLLREGGSIPIVNNFKKTLRADTLMLGLALPDDNLHSPNEKFSLDCFARGMFLSAWLWQELGGPAPAP